MAGVNKLTRSGKSHDNDPEVRHRRWQEEAEGFAERESLIASVTGHEVKIAREAIREFTDRLDDLPCAPRARGSGVPPSGHGRGGGERGGGPDGPGGGGDGHRAPAAETPRSNGWSPRSRRPNLAPAWSTPRSIPPDTTSGWNRRSEGYGGSYGSRTPATGCRRMRSKDKVEALLERGYPLSQEQSLAIRHATVRGGRVSVIEGAAGSGKTTTLRPITDLHKEHGYEIVPTAVAWRTAVALGDDCDARPYCVDKLLKLAAKGQVEIGKRTLIVVDEAGMLSTRQAHHILQLSERHGAKVVFAGDTRQQQPVEAGPGLRLIRDVAGSVRVDRIRRQKADLEDVLVHVHWETPEQARFRAGLTSPEEQDAILAAYEAMNRKPAFTPWQVSVSAALRDGVAEQTIEAWHLRNRLHLCHDEEKTLTRLVDDWARHVRAESDSSTVVACADAGRGAGAVLAHARARALREDRHQARRRRGEPRPRRAGDRAAGDRRRRPHSDRRHAMEEAALQRHRGHRRGPGGPARREQGPPARTTATRSEDDAEAKTRERNQPSIQITAHTGDGRRVTFLHDEIRDWHDNIRLDYGYAMTIASAQGLTVDRTFLLVDDRPARETIYPAATRHREGIDI